MKIIFLNIDGVLTYQGYKNKSTDHIDVKKVNMVKEICNKTNAKVVISSSWKGNLSKTPKRYYTLMDILSDNGINVVGITPCIPSKYEPVDDCDNTMIDSSIRIVYGTGRGAEINQWLKEHKNVDSFVIIDDENWYWNEYNFEKKWVQPSWFNGGLNQKHVNDAIKILNKR